MVHYVPICFQIDKSIEVFSVKSLNDQTLILPSMITYIIPISFPPAQNLSRSPEVSLLPFSTYSGSVRRLWTPYPYLITCTLKDLTPRILYRRLDLPSAHPLPLVRVAVI